MDDCDQSDLFREEKDEQTYSQTDGYVWLKSGIQKRVALASVFSQRAGSMTSGKEGTERELAKLCLECCQQAYSETAVKEAAKVGNQVLLGTGTIPKAADLINKTVVFFARVRALCVPRGTSHRNEFT